MNHEQRGNLRTPSRREMLRVAACGFGGAALAAILNQAALAANPLAARQGHHPAKAKRVIFMFMQGGPSQMESFDYKPRLSADHGRRRNLVAGRAEPDRFR